MASQSVRPPTEPTLLQPPEPPETPLELPGLRPQRRVWSRGLERQGPVGCALGGEHGPRDSVLVDEKGLVGRAH